MTKKENLKLERMAQNYLKDILEEAEKWHIEVLSKEVKPTWEVEIITTFWGPTVWLDLKEDEINFYFSYSPFEYNEGITDRDTVEKIKQAI